MSSETWLLVSLSWELGTHPSAPQLLFALLIPELFGSGFKSRSWFSGCFYSSVYSTISPEFRILPSHLP